MDSYFISII